MIKKIGQLIGDISIRYKIFISYIIILCSVFGIILFFNSIFVTNDIKSNTFFSAQRVLEQTTSFIEYKVLLTKNTLNLISINEQLQTIFEHDQSYYDENIGRWAIDSIALKEVLFYINDTLDIESVKLYFKSSLATIYENDQYLNLDRFSDAAWYNEMSKNTNKVKWFINNDNIVAMKKVPSRNNLNTSLGIIEVNYPTEVFEELLNQALVTNNTMVFLINSGQIVSTSSTVTDDYAKKVMRAIQSSTIENPKTSEEWIPFLINQEKLYVNSSLISNNEWKLLLVIPEADIVKNIQQSRFKMTLLFLIIVPFTFPIAYIVSTTITKRIATLTKLVRSVDTSNFDQEISSTSKDEVGILANNFNYMLVKISILLDEKYNLGQEIKNAELNALQAQINPHFLYNTLDQLYWLGIRNNAPQISDLVLHLSKFYKLSLGNGKEQVTLQDELEHIQAYVQIQNFRFEEAIELIIHIDEEIRQIEIPKITLQPIIENSILHGILEKENPTGKIVITALLGSFLEISIEDNGVGIDPNSLHVLQSSITMEHPQHGYGLGNIDRRLKLIYGSEYGLLFDSELGKGTKVTLRLPNRLSCN